ncbi:MAG: hypothetical protein FWE31_03120 [Firmicutes bacterium]|nr:hypothetical protein [Bacillota bacterium]
MKSFLKKNYIYLILSGFSLGVAITFIVFLANHSTYDYAVEGNPALGVAGGSDRYNAMGALFGLLAGLLVFTLLIAPIVLLMLNKKRLAGLVFGMVGCVGILFMSLALVLPMRSDSYTLLMDIRNGDKDTVIMAYVQDRAITEAFETEEDLADLKPFMDILISTPIDEWAGINTALPGMSSSDVVALRSGIDALQAELQLIIESEATTAIAEAKSEANREYRLTMLKLVAHLIMFGVVPIGIGVVVLMWRKNENMS